MTRVVNAGKNISLANLAKGTYLAQVNDCKIKLVSIKLINEYNTHQELLDKRDELLEEKEYQDNAPLDEDYYIVYVKDNYSIYDTEGTIFVFTK